MHFASVVVVACAAIASARSRAASFPPWAPERELAALSKASAPWADGDGRARVRRELQRSVDALRPRETVADVSALVGEVLRNSGDLILDGRIFAHAHKPGAKDKRRGLAVMLKSATRYVALPNVAWYANEGSGGSLQDRDCRNVSVPFTVIAKKFGYASDCGILVPNPYFGNPGWINDLMGSLESWHHHASALRAAAAARPLATRIPKAFWRGKLLNHEGPNAHAYKFNDGRHVEHRWPSGPLARWSRLCDVLQEAASSLTIENGLRLTGTWARGIKSEWRRAGFTRSGTATAKPRGRRTATARGCWACR